MLFFLIYKHEAAKDSHQKIEGDRLFTSQPLLSRLQKLFKTLYVNMKLRNDASQND